VGRAAPVAAAGPEDGASRDRVRDRVYVIGGVRGSDLARLDVFDRGGPGPGKALPPASPTSPPSAWRGVYTVGEPLDDVRHAPPLSLRPLLDRWSRWPTWSSAAGTTRPSASGVDLRLRRHGRGRGLLATASLRPAARRVVPLPDIPETAWPTGRRDRRPAHLPVGGRSTLRRASPRPSSTTRWRGWLHEAAPRPTRRSPFPQLLVYLPGPASSTWADSGGRVFLPLDRLERLDVQRLYDRLTLLAHRAGARPSGSTFSITWERRTPPASPSS